MRSLLLLLAVSAVSAQTYSGLPLAEASLAYYAQLGEASGNFSDSSGHGLTATAHGTFTYHQTGLLYSDPGFSVLFDGTSAYADLVSSSSLDFSGSTPFTLEAWVKPSITRAGAAAEIAQHDLTSNTSHSPYVASATTFVAGFEAFKAFDGSAGTYWVGSGSGSDVLAMDMGPTSVRIPTQYAITVNSVPEPNRAPRDWIFEGSVDGATWSTVDVRTGQVSWTSGQTRTFTVPATQQRFWRYFRLHVTANNGDPSYTAVAELSIVGKTATFADTTILSKIGGANSTGYVMDILYGAANQLAASINFYLISNFGTGDYLQVYGVWEDLSNAVHHVALTYDGSKTAAGVRIYIDGNLQPQFVAHNALVGSTANTGQFTIGRSVNFGTGNISNVAVYSKALTGDTLNRHAATGTSAPPAYTTPGSSIPVIIDTDLGSDWDDAADIYRLDGLRQAGHLDIRAIIVTTSVDKAAAFVDAELQSIRGPHALPIGAYQGSSNTSTDVFTAPTVATYATLYPTKGSRTNYPDCVDIYRKTLNAAAANSIVIVTIGTLECLNGLVQSGANNHSDGISSTGVQLITAKVASWRAIAGLFPSGWDYDIASMDNGAAAANIVANWPTSTIPIYWQGVEALNHNPESITYAYCRGGGDTPLLPPFLATAYSNYRATIDPPNPLNPAGDACYSVPTILALQGQLANYASLTGPGSLVINTGDGTNTWSGTAHNQFYSVLTAAMPWIRMQNDIGLYTTVTPPGASFAPVVF